MSEAEEDLKEGKKERKEGGKRANIFFPPFLGVRGGGGGGCMCVCVGGCP